MKQSKDFFWPSYVDLMTALFLVMLVLFVLSYKLFQDKQKDNINLIAELRIKAAEKEKLDEITKALKQLENSHYFIYNQEFKRYELSFKGTFGQHSAVLPPEALKPLADAGRFLLHQIKSLRKNDNIQYLIVIEGRAAKDPRFADTDFRNADTQAIRELSYNRALAVIRLWEQAGIVFPANVEVVAAGSGYRGAGRYKGFNEEQKNKRFIIQIQPKIGSLDAPSPPAR